MKNRRISWTGLFVGLAAGLAISLFYTWIINPVVEYDTAPWQLSDEARDQYMGMIGQAYSFNENFARAEERISAFKFDNPGVEVARRACAFFRRAEDLALTLGLVDLAHAYGETTCVDVELGGAPTPGPTSTNTPLFTPTPTPSVTPTPTATATATPRPTNTPDLSRITPTATLTPTPAGPFELHTVTAFCNADYSGVVEVLVQETDATGISGIEVLVTWEGGEDRLFTGLQPGEDPGFANFVMETGQTYRVELPGRANASREMQAQPCTPAGGLPDGEVVLNGYVVKFLRGSE
jgi:hypothetical protein